LGRAPSRKTKNGRTEKILEKKIVVGVVRRVLPKNL
jgi:hypothetical protein